jgi:4-carboxymuconolactone decarboxylase
MARSKLSRRGIAMRRSLPKDPAFRKGLKIRKEVAGAEFVERRLAAANELSWPFEELTTRFAWGMVWSRPTLPRKIRSFLNLAALTAMNMRHELKTHIRGALRNGLTRKEIAEALLHCIVYCGFPKGLDALRLMQEVFAEIDAEAGRKRTRK